MAIQKDIGIRKFLDPSMNREMTLKENWNLINFFQLLMECDRKQRLLRKRQDLIVRILRAIEARMIFIKNL